jgi:class 3 adenylate cyclase
MVVTTRLLERWLQHILGTVELRRQPGVLGLREAAELNQSGAQIISTFGQRQFTAFVGFIDIRGFSDLCRGKTPVQVRDIAKPFVDTVVAITRHHQAFVDKTIGDEVMVVIPSFGQDVLLAHEGIARISFFDVAASLEKHAPGCRFSAGFAFGQMILDRIGIEDGYAKWTVYGNVVNAAKRLQAEASAASGQGSTGHPFALGAIDADEPGFRETLDALSKMAPTSGIGLHGASVRCKELKGVGQVSFLHAEAAVAASDAQKSIA